MKLRAEAVAQDQPNKTHYDLMYYVNATTDYNLMVEEDEIDSDMNVYLAIEAYCKRVNSN